MARLLLCLAASGLFTAVARAQDPELLRLQGVVPGGARAAVTENPTTFRFSLFNYDTVPRDARVVVFYPEQKDVQYARDVWVPAQSALTTWLPIGPAPKQSGDVGRELHMLLFDRTNGGNRLVLPPGSERERTRLVLYRKREPTVSVVRDHDPEANNDAASSDSLLLNYVVRNALGLSENVSFINDSTMPPTAETFDGIDLLVLAGNGLDADPPSRATMRRWLEHGGTLWVMLDQLKPDTIASLLGDDFDIGVIDRVGLTTIDIKNSIGERGWPPRDEEQPVGLVRVVPSAADRVTHTVNGWPAAFVRRVGRGSVVFTTLGPRGWHRPRVAGDPRVPVVRVRRSLPFEHPFVLDLGGLLYPMVDADTVPPDVFRPLIADEIGYKVVSRQTVALVLGGFVAALLGVGLAVRRSRRPELLGLAVPAVVLLATGILVASGARSREAVPPTVALAGIVSPTAGTGESVSSGLFAVYNPASGPVAVGSAAGTVLDLDADGLDGQLRRRVQTDTDRWQWEGLSLPAGVRTGAYRSVARTGRITAVARFGPAGVQGTLETGTFSRPADAIAITSKREPVAAKLHANGAFTIGSDDTLPPGQFVAGAVLSDRQQRRQAVHQQLLAGKLPRYLDERDTLLAWVESPDVPFTWPDGARVIGTSLLAVPMEFERTPPGTRVTVPAAFSPFRRTQAIGDVVLTRTGSLAAKDMRIRFQLPAVVRPLRVERVSFTARISAPHRTVTVSGPGGSAKPVFSAVDPIDPIRVELSGASAPQSDARGGVEIVLNIGEAIGKPDATWKIESLGLEVIGTTADAK